MMYVSLQIAYIWKNHQASKASIYLEKECIREVLSMSDSVKSNVNILYNKMPWFSIIILGYLVRRNVGTHGHWSSTKGKVPPPPSPPPTSWLTWWVADLVKLDAAVDMFTCIIWSWMDIVALISPENCWSKLLLSVITEHSGNSANFIRAVIKFSYNLSNFHRINDFGQMSIFSIPSTEMVILYSTLLSVTISK